MIVPNCRQRITGQDLAFVLQVLHKSEVAPADATALLPHEGDVDDLLDSRELFDALIQTRRLLSISPYFFYYVLVRQVFLERGISERAVADYVGALLCHFLEGRRLVEDAESAPRSFVYLVDLVQSLRAARDARAAFAMEARIGDVALFLTGVFPDAIYHRQTYGRRLPGIDYYEAVGRSGYRAAAQHAPARHADLGDVLDYMASYFGGVRRALNDLSDAHFCIGSRHEESVDRLLRQALYGSEAEPGEDQRRDWGDG
ncbi:MAG: hypothetical protein ABR599_06285 [Gemmatimonadota bacterium]